MADEPEPNCLLEVVDIVGKWKGNNSLLQGLTFSQPPSKAQTITHN
jgi:hypothetical protein